MEFQKHLAEQRIDSAEQERILTMPANAKVEINDLLFRLMPPKTTIMELDDLACAIFLTVEGAWQSRG